MGDMHRHFQIVGELLRYVCVCLIFFFFHNYLLYVNGPSASSCAVAERAF